MALSRELPKLLTVYTQWRRAMNGDEKMETALEEAMRISEEQKQHAIKRADEAESRAEQLEAERDEWKEAHSQACRLLDTVQEQRDEARAKLALVKAEAEYWFTQYKLATSNTVSMEAIP